MRGTSAQSFETVRDQVREVIRNGEAAPRTIAEELFAVVELIDSSNRLVRVLSDVGRSEAERVNVVNTLFEGKVSALSLDIVRAVVRKRWSLQDDLLEALRRIGVDCVLLSAQSEQRLNEVEDELFQVSHLIESHPELSDALNPLRNSAQERQEVINRLFDQRVSGDVRLLLSEASANPGEEKVSARVLEFAHMAAALRDSIIAVVSSATPLTQAQQERLTHILERMYGQSVQVNLLIDPSVVGGMRIEVGDDLYDATILRRLDDGRRRLTS